MFERIQKTFYEIKTVLLNNETIKKLLYYDTNAALKLENVQSELIDEFITLSPIYDLTEDYKKNAIIQIELDSGDNEDNIFDGIIRVNIVMNKEKWELLDNKIRPLMIADETIRAIENKKFSVSNKLEFYRILPLIINKNITGYALLFSLTDGIADKVDI